MNYEANEDLYIQEEEYIQAEREAYELFMDDMRAEAQIMEIEENNQ